LLSTSLIVAGKLSLVAEMGEANGTIAVIAITILSSMQEQLPLGRNAKSVTNNLPFLPVRMAAISP
jgi:hypothetical protein